MAEEHAVTFSAGLAAGGLIAAHDHLLDVPAARLRPDHPRRRRAGPERSCCASTAPASSARTARRSTACFDVGYLRMIPGVVRHAARGRRGAARHAVDGGDTGTRTAPIAVRYPRATIPEESLPAREPQVLEIGTGASSCGRAATSRIMALGTMVAARARRGRGAARRRASRPPSSTRASRARSTPW